MHTRSTLLSAATGVTQAAREPDATLNPDPTLIAAPPQDEAGVPSTRAAVEVATTGSRPVRVDKASKPVAKPALSKVEGRTYRRVTATPATRARDTKDSRGIMNRLRLGWLRVRVDPL